MASNNNNNSNSRSNSNKRILVIGAGGVGGYFGAALAKAGHDVTFLVRGKQLNAIKHSGIKVSSSVMGDFHVSSVHAISDPSEAKDIDLVLLGVKTWQVKEVGETLTKLKSDNFSVLPLQNGVDAYDDLVASLPAEKVLAGSCQIISYLAEPGHIVHIGVEPKIVFGEWNNARTPRVQELANMFTEASIHAEIPDSIQKALWEKFLFIASVGGVGSVTRVPYGVMRDNQPTLQMLKAAFQEVCDVGIAHKIPLTAESVENAVTWFGKVPDDGTPSMERDVVNGYPSELEHLSGAVARLGKKVSVETPVHSFIYASLLPREVLVRQKK